MTLEDGMIYVEKSKALSDENSFIRKVISLVTTSRYTHTGTLLKVDGRWTLFHSHSRPGVHSKKVSREWILDQHKKGNIELIRDTQFNREQFLKRFKKVEGRPYWHYGLFLIGVRTLFGVKLKKSNYTGKFFCSHLTAYLHGVSGTHHYYAPSTFAHGDRGRFKYVVK